MATLVAGGERYRTPSDSEGMLAPLTDLRKVSFGIRSLSLAVL